MTYLEKLLLVLITAVVVFYFGLEHRPVTGQTPVPGAVAPPSAPATPTPATQLAGDWPLTGAPVRTATKPDTMTVLRLKLRAWRESQFNDPDDEAGRARLLQEMLGMVTDANAAEIVQALTAEEMSTPFGSGALHHWMQVDPTTASNWVMSHSDATHDQILTIATDWVGDPDGMQKFIDQLPEGAMKQSFLENASSEMSFKDPLAALKLAQQMQPGDAQTNMLRAVVTGLVGTNPNAAWDWINTLQDPSLREQVAASAAQAYAVTNPAQAADWLVTEVKSDAIIKESALNILNTWVTTDPAAAANWATQFPEGDTKAEAVKIVATHWSQTDPEAGNAWIQNLSGVSP